MKTMSWFRNVALAFLCACTFCAMAAMGQEFPVATKTLKNGMKVLVQTDHSIPNVALYIFYRIGSRNEGPGTTGISHFFEHMMFNGAKKDRKSTRLNSSHLGISYAVFCLKKKTEDHTDRNLSISPDECFIGDE